MHDGVHLRAHQVCRGYQQDLKGYQAQGSHNEIKLIEAQKPIQVYLEVPCEHLTEKIQA